MKNKSALIYIKVCAACVYVIWMLDHLCSCQEDVKPAVTSAAKCCSDMQAAKKKNNGLLAKVTVAG